MPQELPLGLTLGAWIAIGAVVGILIAAVVYIVVSIFLKKFQMEIGQLRPQVMIVLLSLFIITMWALQDDSTFNIATLAVGGLIALATRIIEKD